MNESKFKVCIGLLSKYFNSSPNDMQYRIIWEAMKKYTDEKFEEICREVVKLFSPTSATPFPLVHNFFDAKMKIDESRYFVEPYKQIESNEEIASAEDVRAICAEVFKKIGRGRLVPGCVS